MKLLILVLDCNVEPFPTIKNEGIKKTWFNYNNPNVDVYFYKGGYKNREIIDRDILLTSEDDQISICKKTIECFNFVLDKFDFDFLYRTNTSSFLNIQKMYETFKDYKNNTYSGYIGFHKNIKFVSGSGYLISRNLVKYLTSLRIDYNLFASTPDMDALDDVMVGYYLSHINIIPQLRKDLNITSNIKNIEHKKYFHYRCKCVNRMDDIKIMNKLYKIL